MREQRYYAGELRSTGGRCIGGYAARYGVLSHDLNGFRERIKKGAFRSVLAKGGDTILTINHDVNQILGRRSAGLVLREDDGGLYFEGEMPNTTLGNDTLELCRRGILRECSFAFEVGDDNVDTEEYEDEDGERCRGLVRSIKSFRSLHDVSVVVTPAYPSTNAGVVRSLFPEGVPAHIEARMRGGNSDAAVVESFKEALNNRIDAERRKQRLHKVLSQ